VFSINALTSNYIPAATRRAIRKTDQWQKLAVGELKMDIDASFYEDGSGAIGTIS
jgi:hypothetical protein